MYEIDWGAITTLGGSIVAIVIFLQWKNQKGSEAIANESRELSIKLLKYLKQIDELHLHLRLNDRSKIMSDFPAFDDMFNDVLGSLRIITESIDDEDLRKIESFLDQNSCKFSYLCMLEINLINPDLIYFSENEYELMKNLKENIDEIRSILIKYATYRKKAKLIKDKKELMKSPNKS